MGPSAADSPEPFVSWAVGPPQRGDRGYVTEVSIQVENPAAAESLAVLIKADVALRAFHLFETGPELVERSSSRRLRDGRELIVVNGEIAGLYTAKVTTDEPVAIEAEAVLDVPMWGQ